MCRLEHVNLVVRDVKRTLSFLQAAFPSWKIRGRGNGEWYGKKRAWLHVGDDDTYITLNQGSDDANRYLKGNAPGLAHMGFCVDDLEAVSSRLLQRGYEITTMGAEHPYRKTLYFVDPAGFEFEFIQYLSSDPLKKNMYGGEISPVKRLNFERKKETNMGKEAFVKEMYKYAVDGKNVDLLSTYLCDDIRFRLGNYDAVNGLGNVLDANKAFFDSITSMAHQIDSIWSENDTLICNGLVNYVRLDQSTYSASFATILKFQGKKISEYLVYADISEL